ncbi:tRNA (adenosine(37)-N6)-threonylcarbamoyltransferase complex dimerization subunit type 1 TsaB [Stieleria sp. TO1_6]|uniref:tRNA (adenosine(37)-N6)-threonylcarbamoyltransferase complex dimerization subunit type 1 TsaB n=1 Tax=Stieleria tagensis TaxID=2956795 RepID=UPI00209AA785|nr:tRNA (adenosine(37)-N6)-threonylcarbamoyltransferase complex dimerization subunit type 1 TsaB [Stieleria tagensis]MCO8122254.1 tRNA (adenosine(37)-N6)-threonylcarbamoyltransferase complex dimerization subunit type 1 TsaB [Stieleria tagensis]
MLQIALETIGKSGSLAVLDQETVVWQRSFGDDRRTAAVLAVHLDAAVRWCEDQQQAIQWVSVAVGPGSFTGLRIGITTAKTLAYAMHLPTVPVGSLAAIAAAIEPAPEIARILVGLNAYRGQVFAAEFDTATLRDIAPPATAAFSVEVLSRDQWNQRVSSTAGSVASDGGVALAGDLSIIPSEWTGLFQAPQPNTAVGVGRIANRLVERQSPSCSAQIDPFSLSARYVKLSAAEEQAASR